MRRESLSALQRFGSILRGPVCASYIFGAFRERYCSSMPRPGERVFDCRSEASWCARQPCAMRNTEDCRVRRRSLRRGGFFNMFFGSSMPRPGQRVFCLCLCGPQVSLGFGRAHLLAHCWSTHEWHIQQKNRMFPLRFP